MLSTHDKVHESHEEVIRTALHLCMLDNMNLYISLLLLVGEKITNHKKEPVL